MYILVLGLCLNTQETNRFDDVGNQYNICLNIEKVKATMSKWKKVKRGSGGGWGKGGQGKVNIHQKRSDFQDFGGVCSFNPYKGS